MDKKMMADCARMMHAMHKKGGANIGSHIVKGSLGRSILSRPLAVFSLGATIGAMAYKNREKLGAILSPATKEVVRTVTRTSDAGKDFLQEQKEKLSDIVAEVKEEEEEAAMAGAEAEAEAAEEED